MKEQNQKIVESLKGLNEYERMAVIQKYNKFGDTISIGVNTTYSYYFIEIYPLLRIYRIGYSNSTIKAPSGLIQIDAKNKKQINDLVIRLDNFHYHNFDRL